MVRYDGAPMGESPRAVLFGSCVRLAILVGQVLLASCTTTNIIVNPASDESNDGASPPADVSTDAPSSSATVDATMVRSDASVAQSEASVAQAEASIDAGAATDGAATLTDAPGSVGETVDAATDGPTSETDAEIDAGRLRCDANGMNCRCFNVASLGYGGHVGSQLGMGGTDNTQTFGAYLSQQSTALFAQVGCGVDIGCTNPDKPDLSDLNFLPSYDVLIFQWMAGALLPVTNGGGSTEGYEGSSYWAFSQRSSTR